MEKNTHLSSFANELANKYTMYFDVFRNEWLEDIPLSFLAQYRRRDERYMFTKKIKIYGVENQQIVFATTCNEVDTDFIQQFQQRIKDNLHHYTIKHQEHMSTIVIGLIMTDEEVHSTVAKEVSRYRKLKFLKYGLHGWAEIYLAIIQPHKKKIFVHPKGKPFISSIEKYFWEGNKVK